MNYETKLMRTILTSPKAQEIINYVSPIYGNSYVGLWIFEAIGAVLGEIYDIGVALQNETNPATADLLLDIWEKHYGIVTDPTLTSEQRRARIIAKTQSRGPCNRVTLETAISAALGGVEVDIEENIAKNTFLVNIREVVDSINPAVAVIERMKPAHLIYQIRVATQTVSEATLKTAVAVTRAEIYKVEVYQ